MRDRLVDWDAFFRAVLWGVFLLAALPKIQDPAAFAKIVNNYHLVPGRAVNAVALYLPWIELFAGFAVIVPVGRAVRQAGVLLVALMLAAFIGAQGWAWVKGIDTACGCFSVTEAGKSAGVLGVVGNVVLLACAVFSLAVGSVPESDRGA